MTLQQSVRNPICTRKRERNPRDSKLYKNGAQELKAQGLKPHITFVAKLLVLASATAQLHPVSA